MRTTAVMMAAVLATAGCGARWIDVAMTGPVSGTEARPEDVAVFYLPPPCNYREVGMLEARAWGWRWWRTTQETIDAMRREASRRGVDAILIANHGAAGAHAAQNDLTAIAIELDPATSCAATPAPVAQSER